MHIKLFIFHMIITCLSCFGKALGNYLLNGRERSKAKKEMRNGENAPNPSTFEYLILQHTERYGFSTNILTTVKKIQLRV